MDLFSDSIEEFPTFAEWYANRSKPFLFGADGDDDGGEGDGVDDDDSDEFAGDDDGDDDDNAYVRLPKKEADALRHEVAKARDEKRKAEAAAKKERERVAAEEGRFSEVIEEREREAQEAAARAEAAEFELDQFQRQIRVSNIANKLGFKDPSDAFRFLSDDDTGDDDTAERALKRLADSKDYLIERRRPSGGPVNGGSKGLTMDQIKNMSQEEINANWEAVQAAMAAAS